jgi:fumarate hydratase subunit alpha
MTLKTKIEKVVAQANFVMRNDVGMLLKRAYLGETNKRAKRALAWILDNEKEAKKERLAICQDTGLPIVFIEAGKDVKIDASLVEEIKKGVEGGYKKNYLRPSMVDPHVRGKSGYEGALVHVDFSSKSRGLKITIFPKGFGSENKSQLKMFNPTVGSEKIEEFILDCVKTAGPESCPPFIVGIGIGGTSDKALFLAKKAFLDRVDKANPDKKLDKLEKGLLKKINALKIGPMGLGGKSTCLAVKIKKAPTHIAGLPVGVNISCWALRSATLRLKGQGSRGFLKI